MLHSQNENRIAMIERCPSISDPTKMTLINLYFNLTCGNVIGRRRLAAIRNVSEGTISNHFKEALDCGVIEKSHVVLDNQESKSIYSFNWDGLANTLGLQYESNFDLGLYVDSNIPESGKDAKAMVEVLREPKTPADFVKFFSYRFKSFKGSDYKAEKRKDFNRIKIILRTYSPSEVKIIIEEFLSYCGRMYSGPANIESMYKQRQEIATGAGL